LHAEAVRCMLPVSREMKTEIPDHIMSDKISAAVVWFDKGLQINKLQPRSATSREALAEAFKCYAVGVTSANIAP